MNPTKVSEQLSLIPLEGGNFYNIKFQKLSHIYILAIVFVVEIKIQDHS